MAIGVIAGQGQGASHGSGIAILGDKGFIVAGDFWGTIAFDPGPSTITFEHPYNSHFLARYDVGGELLWVARADDDSNGMFLIAGVAADATGNSYAVGNLTGSVDFDPGDATSFQDSSGIEDYLVKFDANGDFVWAVHPEGSTGCGATAVVVDAGGAILTTGFFTGSVDFDPGTGVFHLDAASGQDHYVAKYDADGALLWATHVDPGADGSVSGYGLAVDGTGHSYATGYFSGTVDFDPGAGTAELISGTSSHYLARYDEDGSLVWAAGADAGSSGSVYGYGVAVDDDGNSFVVGSFNGTVDFEAGDGAQVLVADAMDFFVAKYDGAGSLAWVRHAAASSDGDYGNAVAVDGDGNVQVVGTFDGTVDFGGASPVLVATGPDHFAASYDGDGELRWVRHAGNSTDEENARAVAVDAEGRTYVAGQFTGTVDFDPGGTAAAASDSGLHQFFAIVYSAEGEVRYLEPQPPPPPRIIDLADSADDHLTVDTTPGLEGTAEALATIHILRDGVDLDTVQADEEGRWTWEDPGVAPGGYVYTALAVDGGGYESGLSRPFDVFVGSPGATTGNGADMAAGTAGKNVLDGKNGDDTVFAADANDTLKGGNGNDRLYGGNDDDALWGGNGNDTAVGGSGRDTLYGEAGGDSLWGGDGSDRIEGGAAGDLVDGDAANDTLHGGEGMDTLLGGVGADRLSGDAMGDWILPGDDKAIDTVFGTVAHLTDDTIQGFVVGLAGDLLAISGLAARNGKLLDSIAITDGVLSLSKVGGGTILFEDLAGAPWTGTHWTDTMTGGDGSILIYVM
ncbi:hemolysin type calcium-binding protein [Stella humosa]|uniref:Hemolysin type calcium-binding protein n=1 Tax=Stella humosa TaxID=94 RepID=A0A3N1MCU4_9PROT|nr:SBBP repeat-containing protein [Stella humosa]ROQ01523.1 hemolysin type calcium-binding protein [Stella humosa]BBK31902.1 hypothetical protein STHU_25360 [Stella humosa]